MISSAELGVVIVVTIVALIVGARVDGLRCSLASGVGGLTFGLAGAYCFGVPGTLVCAVIGAAFGIVIIAVDADGDVF